MKILIVDDDPSSRMALDLVLREMGHEVTLASAGGEALRLFEKGNVPVLISDWLMPDLDGLELCRRIRAANRPQYTYVLLLTVVGGRIGYLEGMRAGADDFITKPFDREILGSRLVVAERILSLQSQVRQLSGLLPICARCKNVRDDQNYWHAVESYIEQHTAAKFTHGYCPECFTKLANEIEAVVGPKDAAAT